MYDTGCTMLSELFAKGCVITLENHSMLYSRPIFLSVMLKMTPALGQLELHKVVVLFGCHANPFIPLILLISNARTTISLLFAFISSRSAIFPEVPHNKSGLLSI